jgi:hypothetical protein
VVASVDQYRLSPVQEPKGLSLSTSEERLLCWKSAVVTSQLYRLEGERIRLKGGGAHTSGDGAYLASEASGSQGYDRVSTLRSHGAITAHFSEKRQAKHD